MQNKNMTTINQSSVDRKSNTLCSYRLWFLLENTSHDTKYIDVYKDVVNVTTGTYYDQVSIVDHDSIVDLLQNDVEYIGVGNDDAYRAAFKRARTVLHVDGQIPTTLLVELTHLSISAALRQFTCKNDVVYKNEYDQSYISSLSTKTTIHQRHVILTNFFDLDFVAEFLRSLGPQQRVDAIVRLSCGEICKTRGKFVTKACMDEQLARDEKIRRFWWDLNNKLNTKSSASIYKNVVIYAYESKYDARFEPPDPEQIVATLREYVFHEMNRVQDFVSNITIEYDRFVENLNSVATYNFTTVSENDLWPLYNTYAERLNGYPVNTITVTMILDAMIATICSPQKTRTRRSDDWAATVDVYFNALRDESNDGCLNYSICVPYGNECARTVQKYGELRFASYITTITNVLATRWRRSLWGARLLLPLETETEYDATISDVKRQCVCDDDVDVRLCVLALNRLRSNLDVFRGETISLPGLEMTKVRFTPEFIEPLDCSTMVQTLEKQSETRMKISYAYFEPEDVILVGFYDFQDTTWTRKSSFNFDMPQQPIHMRDHFDFFRNKKVPKFVYPALGSSITTYREHTEEIRFCDGDYLTVIRRRWRFDLDTTCLIYKSKSYEFVRHATEDVDRFRINTNTGCTYNFDKYQGDIIGFYADDGTNIIEINTERNIITDAICLQRLWQSKGSSRTEKCRSFGNSSVVVEFKNGSHTVTYWAFGYCTRTNFSGSHENRTFNATPLKSSSGFGTTNRSTVPPTQHLKTPSRFTVPSQFKTPQDNAAVSSMTSIRSKISDNRVSPTQYLGIQNDVTVPVPALKQLETGISVMSIKNIDRKPSTWNDSLFNYSYDTDYGISNCSNDGKKLTVKFEDGTEIVTYVHEVSVTMLGLSADWVIFEVSKREYTHPDYRTVVEHRDGTVYVPDLIRCAPNGSMELRLQRLLRIEVTATAVDIYRDDPDTVPPNYSNISNNDSSKIATFPWTVDVDLLFEKRDGKRRLVRCGRTTTTRKIPSSCLNGRPSAAAYFIVKRNMTGFRLLDHDQYDEFIGQIRNHDNTVIRETHDEIATLHDSDLKLGVTNNYSRSNLTTSTVSQPRLADRNCNYEWLNVFSSKTGKKSFRTVTPKRLVSRMFRKLSTDYEPVLKALRNIHAIPIERQTTLTTKLVVRMYVPNLDHVKALYRANGLGFWYESPIESNDDTCLFIKHLLNGTVIKPSVKLALQKEIRKYAFEAQMRLRTNNFIPYFHRDYYIPFRNYYTTQ